MAKRAREKIPLSGDRLVDTIFKMLLDTLNNEVDSIKVKKVLRYPDKKKEELRGLLTEGKIFLGKRKHKRKKESMVGTLVHEVAHATCPNVIEERIRQFESALCLRLTDAQKRYLREYIPRHVVKEEPNFASPMPERHPRK